MTAQQTSELCEILKNPPEAEKAELLALLVDRVHPDDVAYVKAGFLTAVAKGEYANQINDHPVENLWLLSIKAITVFKRQMIAEIPKNRMSY